MTNFLSSLTAFFVNKQRIAYILIIGIIGAGIYGILNNQRQAFPNIPFNQVLVTAVYPGASAEIVEEIVSSPIEKATSSLDTVISTSSISKDNLAQIFVESSEFRQADLDKLANQITSEINKLSLPSEVDTDVITLEASSETLYISIIDPSKSDLDQVLNAKAIRDRLLDSSEDIKGIRLIPEAKTRADIVIDKNKMNDAGLNLNQIKEALESDIIALPGGSVTNSEEQAISINIEPTIRSLSDLKTFTVEGTNLLEIATIEEVLDSNTGLQESGYVDDNGEIVLDKGIYLVIEQNIDGDAINISDAVKEEIEVIKSEQGFNFEYVILFDGAEQVSSQINDLLSSGLIGLLLIIIVLLIFINFRAALVVGAILPLAFLITLFTLLQINFSINILTLFAMILALGIIIDNAIVIAEGIVFEIEKGKKRKYAAINAVKNFGPSITAATITTLIVFIPFANIGGVIGEFMKFIPYTIIIMMATSYFLAITITPFIGSKILNENLDNSKPNGWTKYLLFPLLTYYAQAGVNQIALWYKKGLKYILSGWVKRTITFVISLIILFGGFFFAGQVPGGSFPEGESDIITIDINYDSSFAQSDRDIVNGEVNEIVRSVPDFVKYYSLNRINSSQNVIEIKELKDRKDKRTAADIELEIDRKLSVIENRYDKGVRLEAEIQSQGPPSVPGDVTWSIKTENTEKAKNFIEDVQTFVSNDERVKRVNTTFQSQNVTGYDVVLDRAKLSVQNLNSIAVSSIINSNYSKTQVGSINSDDGSRKIDVSLGFSQDSIENNLNLFKILPGTTLEQIAEVSLSEKLSQIEHDDGIRVYSIQIDLFDPDLSSELENEMREEYGISIINGFNTIIEVDRNGKYASFGLTSEEFDLGGASSEEAESFQKLGVVAIIALVLVFIILVNQFNSFSKGLLILLTVAFAFAGVFPGLLLVGETINFISGLGMVALIGIAINDAIVFIDTYQKRRKASKELDSKGETMNESLVETGYQRFKPILSTTLTTCLGILPLAIVDPFWRGLGTSIIAGLTFSTIATLIFVPVWQGLRGEKIKKK